MQKLGSKTYDCAVGCPVEATLDLIDGKWKGVILYHLLDDQFASTSSSGACPGSRSAC